MAFMNQERKKALAPRIKTVLKKYGMKGTIAVRHHSTLILNIKSGRIDFSKFDEENRGYINVNVYWINEHFDGVARDFLLELHAAMMVGNHDRSDSMTDYFDVGWYTDINIGDYDKPYQLVV